MATILEDTLNEELTETGPTIPVQEVFNNSLCDPDTKKVSGRKTRSLDGAKSLLEFFGLVGQAIENMENRSGVIESERVIFTEEEPDTGSKTETIAFSLVTRQPGAFGQGPPMNPTHRNLKPMFREEESDPNNPGYRIMTLGYWYDNIVRFTCWARTNKVANIRAEWFENLMEEYSWWFKLKGVERTIFQGRNSDIVVTVDQNKWYGRPIDYFVRTEKLRVFREKSIEEILVKYKVQT